MAKVKQFIIQDWAGNVLENGMTFASFEDAWDHILGDMTDRLGLTEDDYSKYYAEEANVRSARYLQANDPRAGLMND